MSGSAVITNPAPAFSRHVLRYAFGATFIMAVAMAMSWKLSYVLPVLSLSFLASGNPAPSFKTGLGFVLTIVLACLAGLFFSKLFIPYPLVFFSLLFVSLLHLFYSTRIPAFLKTWLMLALLLIPMISSQSIALAEILAINIALAGAISIALIWFIFAFIPEPHAAEDKATDPAQTTPTEKKARFQKALKSTLVVFPVLLLFHLFQWTGAVLILIFIAILSMQPAFAQSFKMGVALIIGNLIGGLAAILYYELLVMVPLYPFMVLLCLLCGLVFGSLLFSGKPKAALFGMAFSTVLLIIGSTTGGSGEADAKVWTRILQIMTAVTYVVLASGWLDRITKRKK